MEVDHRNSYLGDRVPPYTSLGYTHGDLLTRAQQTGDGTPPRVHLNIDTDDIEAEVRRLEALGARRLEQYGHGLGLMLSCPA